MTTTAWVILIVALAIVIIAGLMMARTRRTKNLRAQFGPEYDHMVEEKGSALRAERELENRAKRVEKFKIRRLTLEECNSFVAQWRATQEHFVDDPRRAVAEADQLVQQAMRARGYPVAMNFEERAADLSVDHARVLDNYRTAHDIAIMDTRSPVSTEDLRKTMKHYRALFEDLVDQHVAEYGEVRR